MKVPPSSHGVPFSGHQSRSCEKLGVDAAQTGSVTRPSPGHMSAASDVNLAGLLARYGGYHHKVLGRAVPVPVSVLGSGLKHSLPPWPGTDHRLICSAGLPSIMPGMPCTIRGSLAGANGSPSGRAPADEKTSL